MSDLIARYLAELAAEAGEPNLDGAMPDAMWAACNGNRTNTTLAIQAAVTVTKRKAAAALREEREAHAALQARCFDYGGTSQNVFDDLAAAKRELAELRAQQPVAWRYQPTGAGAWGHSEERPAVAGVDGWTVQPLYAAQQPKAE